MNKITNPADAGSPAAGAFPPRRISERKSFNTSETNAALCVWEHVLELRETDPFVSLFDELGSCGMRVCAIQAGVLAETVWQHMEEANYEYMESFDWGFVPAIIPYFDWSALTQDNQHRGEIYLPDPATILAKMIEADPANFLKHNLREDWQNNARDEAQHQWGYAGLVDDHREAADRAFTEGQEPATFVCALGLKYDLNSIVPARW